MKKIYINCDLVSMDKNVAGDSFAVEDGIITAVGKKEDLLEENAEVVDLAKMCVLPGFVDAHSHITQQANTLGILDLSSCKNFAEIVEKLQKYIQRNTVKDGDFVVGFGYDNNFLEEKKHPDRHVLDMASKKHAIVIAHSSGHMGVLNTKALEMCNISSTEEDFAGGKYGREKDGSVNGYVEELAFMKASSHIPQKTMQKMQEELVEAEKQYASYGITTCQDGKMGKKEYMLLAACAREKKLFLDVVGYMDMAEKDAVDFSVRKRKYINRFKVDGYKIFLDGSPQGKTAWMQKPYQGEKTYAGYGVHTDSEVLEYLEIAKKENMQILCHCNGDRAAKQYIDCIEKTGGLDKPVMIHAQLATKEQIDKMSKLGIIPSFFVAHVYYWGDVHVKNFGMERARNISLAKEAKEKNIPFTFHQDTPVLLPDMLETLWIATNRITKDGVVLGEENKIDMYSALEAITINACKQYGEEKEKGSITPGKKADFVILSQNPLKVDPRKIKVIETYKEGNCIYKSMQ